MKITLTMNNTIITLENENNAELMNTLDTIMKSFNRPEPSTQANIRNEMREYLAPVVPVQAPVEPKSVQVPRYSFIPASDKQKSLLRSIPEYKGKDLSSVSKSEASMAIERWNKSRSYHYKDHY